MSTDAPPRSLNAPPTTTTTAAAPTNPEIQKRVCWHLEEPDLTSNRRQTPASAKNYSRGKIMKEEGGGIRDSDCDWSWSLWPQFTHCGLLEFLIFPVDPVFFLNSIFHQTVSSSDKMIMIKKIHSLQNCGTLFFLLHGSSKRPTFAGAWRFHVTSC